MMGDFVKRALPGVATAAAALAAVAGYDAVLHADPGQQTTLGTEIVGSAGQAAAPAPQPSCDTAQPASGHSFATPWGPVQVVAEVDSAGRVCRADAAVYPDGDSRSQMINSRAIPQLNAAVENRGVEFDAVSGATYTSEAYRDSLQSILDSL